MKHVYIIGIGGIGTSALAQWLLHQGYSVSGTDHVTSDITTSLKKLGITVDIEDVDMLPDTVDTLVYSDAVPEAHPLRQQAAQRKIPQYSYASMLGHLSKNYSVIAVAGSHGKSTTTSLTGLLFEQLGLDPTVIDGTRVPQWQTQGRLGNFRPGESKYLVVEADEYKNHFHYLKPTVAVITSLDHDHIDSFPTKESYAEAFKKFISNIQPDGTLIVEHSLRESLAPYAGLRKLVSYSLSDSTADIVSSEIIVTDSKQHFTVRDTPFELSVPGQHMVANALGALGAALAVTDEPQALFAAQQTFALFKGTWRRFELLKEQDNILYFSDYAHHPTELKALITAVHQIYAYRRLVLVFQPHQIQRAKAFEKEFKEIFKELLGEKDLLLLCPIYEVLGREEEKTFTAEKWIDEVKGSAQYVAHLEDMPTAVQKHTQAGDLVLFTGAGSIDAIARKFVHSLVKNSL